MYLVLQKLYISMLMGCGLQSKFLGGTKYLMLKECQMQFECKVTSRGKQIA